MRNRTLNSAAAALALACAVTAQAVVPASATVERGSGSVLGNKGVSKVTIKDGRNDVQVLEAPAKETARADVRRVKYQLVKKRTRVSARVTFRKPLQPDHETWEQYAQVGFQWQTEDGFTNYVLVYADAGDEAVSTEDEGAPECLTKARAATSVEKRRISITVPLTCFGKAASKISVSSEGGIHESGGGLYTVGAYDVTKSIRMRRP